jgi:uncharacterized protein (TIGR01777 family)
MTTPVKPTPLRIAITGATGMIGTAVGNLLRQRGHEVLPLHRHATGIGSWNVQTGAITTAGRVDALLHLAGRTVATRWTTSAKKEIWESRVPATQHLCTALAALPASERPRALISASAIGIYGDRGDEVLTEDSAPGSPEKSFLTQVCLAWENAARPAADSGIRVIHPRLGIVLSAHGGALKALVTPTQFGLGGPVGTGLQWMSWISLHDVARLLVHLVETENLAGTVNAVAPTPVRQHEFIRTLGHILHRPTLFPLPAFAVKLAFGQMGQEALLSSQRVTMKQLPTFTCEDVTLAAALQRELAVNV